MPREGYGVFSDGQPMNRRPRFVTAERRDSYDLYNDGYEDDSGYAPSQRPNSHDRYAPSHVTHWGDPYSGDAPPLPPKPPADYVHSVTDAVAEFRINSSDRGRGRAGPEHVSELHDRRPTFHPMGPRRPEGFPAYSPDPVSYQAPAPQPPPEIAYQVPSLAPSYPGPSMPAYQGQSYQSQPAPNLMDYDMGPQPDWTPPVNHMSNQPNYYQAEHTAPYRPNAPEQNNYHAVLANFTPNAPSNPPHDWHSVHDNIPPPGALQDPFSYSTPVQPDDAYLYPDNPVDIPQMSPSRNVPYPYSDDDDDISVPDYLRGTGSETTSPYVARTASRSPSKYVPQSPTVYELDDIENAYSGAYEAKRANSRYSALEPVASLHPPTHKRYSMPNAGHMAPTFIDSRPADDSATVDMPRSSSDLSRFTATTQTSFDVSLRSSLKSADDSLMVRLGLPSIPDSVPKLDATRLASKDYSKCSEIWSLNALAGWILDLVQQSSRGLVKPLDVPLAEVSRALVGLFTHQIPTLNWVQAEQISEAALRDLRLQSGFISLRQDDPQMITLDASNLDEISGVFPMLTRGGCYGPLVHVEDDVSMSLKALSDSSTSSTSAVSHYRCYSPRCSRTLPVHPPVLRIETKRTDEAASKDWAVFFKIDPSRLAELDKREVNRQYAIHELIMGEESYVSDLNILMAVFGDSLAKTIPGVMRNQESFWRNAFEPLKPLIKYNSKLLHDLKAKQREQGPFVSQIAEVILQWVKDAKNSYIAYAECYLKADHELRKERDTNPAFAAWLERAARDPRAHGAPYSFYFHRAIPRLARYSLLLSTIRKATLESLPEWELLNRCVTECDALTNECNKCLDKIGKSMEIVNLTSQIQFKSSEETVDLRLGDPKRRLIRRGDVQRRGDYRLEWVDSHLILLNNYLILSKTRKGNNGTKLYVTKRPIPLDLLVLESVDEAPVAKSSNKFGVGTFTSHVPVAGETAAKRLSKQFLPSSPTKSINEGSGPSPTTPSTGSSVTTLIPDSDKEVMFPFKITHLGIAGGTYVLYTSSAIDRDRWRDAIITAKRENSSILYAQNTEPFRLRVVSETAFGYEGSSTPKLPVFAPASTIDRALAEAKSAKDPPRPLVNSKINCGVTFTFADGNEYSLLGLDAGMYLQDRARSSIWRKCLDVIRVTQIDVVESLNLLIIVADKALLYYDLDAVINQGVNSDLGRRASTSSARSASGSQLTAVGHRLSQHRRVGFFTVGHIKSRTVVFYKRSDGLSSAFKVLEPIREKGSQRRRSKMTLTQDASISSTEFFRETDKFSVPNDAAGISMFKSTFALHTSKGFQHMSLDFKSPQPIPTAASVAAATPILKAHSNALSSLTADAFKKKVDGAKPLGMFRISMQSLILCYDEFALFCDNYGSMTGPVTIAYVCHAKAVALQLPYLVIVGDEMLEVRRLDRGGQLKQVITGKDLRVVDTKEGQIQVVMAHPLFAGRQLVMELIGNEFVKEDDASSLTGL